MKLQLTKSIEKEKGGCEFEAWCGLKEGKKCGAYYSNKTSSKGSSKISSYIVPNGIALLLLPRNIVHLF
jgi:hypothetical protein